ncbi:hypothetical protein V500_03666 [Pseudogymnoascus sp. VKM F-4518 (FW-2643)]|nr:hypothetical protein V500_03666 [Pseudogymnoascus sp. VKM F-4518 (FW-2643)]
MSSDILHPIESPVIQIQLRDPTPLQGAAQDAKIASTILYLATQGLQVHFPPITVEHTFDPVYCDPSCGKIFYTINIEAEEPDVVLKAFQQCLRHHAPSSDIMFVSRHSRAWPYQSSLPPFG